MTTTARPRAGIHACRRHARRGHPARPHMEVRRALLALIGEVIERDGHTSWSLAHCLGMTLPRASNLLHGHIARFNSETLIDVLARLGVSVEISVTRTQRYLRWNIVPAREGWRLPHDVAPRFLAPERDPLSTSP